MSGIDMDERAISWARMLNPDIKFSSESISSARTNGWDSGSLVEVIEHIPPAEIEGFIREVRRVLRPGGSLFVTVPSTQRAVSAKHYQHFTFDSLKDLFVDGFEVTECFGFEKTNYLTRFYFKQFFKRRLHIEIGKVSRYIINTYARKHTELEGCGRVWLSLIVK